MIKRTLILSALTSSLLIFSGQTYAEDQEIVYGSQLMTQQERVELRQRIRNAKTAEERKQIRYEHHQRMQQRAKAQGKTLPDEPPAGGGMRARDGSGPGMGAGKGGGMGGGGPR